MSFLERNLKIGNETLEYVLKNSAPNNPTETIQKFNEYIYSNKNNGIMIVGEQKGSIIDKEIIKAQPKTGLEFGTFLGYSSVRFANLFPEDGKLYSMDVQLKYNQIARKLASHSGLDSKIEYLMGGIESHIEKFKKEVPGGFDFVFIDHVKSLYVPHLKLLEKAGLVRKGTVICADNMIRPGAPQYVEYMQNSKEVYQTRFEKVTFVSGNQDAVAISSVLEDFPK